MTDCIKKGFVNKIEANKRLREILQTNDSLIKPIRVYKCPNCNEWNKLF